MQKNLTYHNNNLDKFHNLIFKEGKKTRFEGTKPLDNLANNGGEIGERYFVNRNGEYNGIVIELIEKIYPQFNHYLVHQIYQCVECDYIGVEFFISKFNLINLYQKYSNDLFKFIIDEFLISNNLEKFYSNYPAINSVLKNDSDIELVKLKNFIHTDIHELIPSAIKVIGTGMLLPSDWVGKVFKSGKEFHSSIDMLDERIGKPPVTYLANYCMVKQKLNMPEIFNSDIKKKYFTNNENFNIFVLNSNNLKFDFGKEHVDPNITYSFIEINFDFADSNIIISTIKELVKNKNLNKEKNYKIIVLFEWDKILQSADAVNQIHTSIGFNVSLLQKSIRKGKETINCLLESVEKLSKAKPFNNPEYSYEMVSGSRQLMWRSFITIIEETKLYMSNKYLEIIDFLIYSMIFSKYPNYFISNELTQKVKKTLILIQASKEYWDFRPWVKNINVKKNINLKKLDFGSPDIKLRQFELGIFLGIKLMPGMKGDKVMLEATINWLNSNPELPILLDINKIIIDKHLNTNTNNFIEKINWFSALDHHSNPNIITQLHNALYGFNGFDKFYKIKNHNNSWTKLEDISSLIWKVNSEYNFRKHQFEWDELNDLVYFIQVMLSDAKSNIIFDSNYDIGKFITGVKKNFDSTNLSDLNLDKMFCLNAELNLKLNLVDLEREKLFWEINLDKTKFENIENDKLNNNISAMRIGQIILSTQYSNNFWYKGKKIIPIYTNEEIKFKYGDTIVEQEDENNIVENSKKDTNDKSKKSVKSTTNYFTYFQILSYYLNNYNVKTKVNLQILNTKSFEIKVKSNSIFINGIECVKIKTKKIEKTDKIDCINKKIQLEWIESGLNNFLLDEKISIYKYKIKNDLVDKKLKYILEISNSNPINKYINYKSLLNCGFKIKSNEIIDLDIVGLIPLDLIKKIICRIETSIEDKKDKIILLLGKVDRSGKGSTEAVDESDEGYLIRVMNVLSCFYGCFEKVNENKFIIHIYSTGYKYWLDKINELENKKNLVVITKEDIKKDKENINKINFIKTKLWKHQANIRDMIIRGINKWGQKGWGDASNVGSGKTLTGLSVIEGISNLCLENNCKYGMNFLILTPNTNLYVVWIDEIKTHCDLGKINCWVQNSNGKWNLENFNDNSKYSGLKKNKSKIKSNDLNNENMEKMNKINLYISTMGRNRDNPIKSNIKFVIIDECLTVQNNTSKWTMKAFEQVVRAKYGVLMLSATFFRTRFDKLFFMLKMFQLHIPTKPEYLDTILNIAIGANIKSNQTKWIETIHKIQMDKEFYVEYSKNKKKDKKESYLGLKKFLFSNVDWEEIIILKTNELIKQGRKVLIFAESEVQLERLVELTSVKGIKNLWSFYPDITKDICVISKHKGTYGINNLVKYNTILMKLPEPDKLPQMKGRLDRPGQMSEKLFIEYIIIADTIDEIDLISLQMANNFYSSHIIPLANYYLKYA